MLNQTYKLFFGTLTNSNRFAVINCLLNGPCNVSNICKKTEINQTTLSHNLRRLEKCGFVTAKQNGKERIYSLNEQTIKPLLKLMDKHINTYCVDCVRR